MAKYAWTWTMKEECLEEYVRLHKNPWPDVVEAHSKAGIKNYSIFQNGKQFFYCFETDDIEATTEYLLKDEANNRWSDVCLPMIDGEPVKDFLEEVWYIK